MLTKKQCSQLKLLGTQFGGLAESPAEYSEKCGMYDEKELNCIRLNSRVQSLVVLNQANTLSSELKTRNAYTDILAKARKEFDDNNCTKIIEQYRQAELGTVIDKFTGIDKKRIESENIYERNQRVFFGGLILISGIAIIVMFGKNK